MSLLHKMANTMSRRDFIKLLGYGVNNSMHSSGVKVRFSRRVNEAGIPLFLLKSSGAWTAGQNTSDSLFMRHNRKLEIFFHLAGSGNHINRANGPFGARNIRFRYRFRKDSCINGRYILREGWHIFQTEMFSWPVELNLRYQYR